MTPWWRRLWRFLLDHWGFTAFAASVAMLVVAGVVYGTSPLYWAKQVAVADRELDRKQAKLDFDRDMAEHYLDLGNKLLDVWKMEEARKAFEDALKLDPTNQAAGFGLIKANAFAVAEPGQYDAEVAERRLSLILEADPNDPHALAGLGDLYYFLGDLQKAAEYYGRAVKQRETLAHAYFGLGMIALGQPKPDYRGAADHMGEAAKLSPHNWRYRNNRAQALADLGDSDAAIAEYRQLSRLDPELILPYLERAVVHRKRATDDDLGAIVQIARYVQGLFGLEKVANADKNRGLWFFETGSGRVYLTTVETKRYYVQLTLATVTFILGDEQGGVADARQAPSLEPTQAADLGRLLDHDLRQIDAARSDLHGRIERLRQVFAAENLAFGGE